MAHAAALRRLLEEEGRASWCTIEELNHAFQVLKMPMMTPLRIAFLSRLLPGESETPTFVNFRRKIQDFLVITSHVSDKDLLRPYLGPQKISLEDASMFARIIIECACDSDESEWPKYRSAIHSIALVASCGWMDKRVQYQTFLALIVEEERRKFWFEQAQKTSGGGLDAASRDWNHRISEDENFWGIKFSKVVPDGNVDNRGLRLLVDGEEDPMVAFAASHGITISIVVPPPPQPTPRFRFSTVGGQLIIEITRNPVDTGTNLTASMESLSINTDMPATKVKKPPTKVKKPRMVIDCVLIDKKPKSDNEEPETDKQEKEVKIEKKNEQTEEQTHDNKAKVEGSEAMKSKKGRKGTKSKKNKALDETTNKAQKTEKNDNMDIDTDVDMGDAPASGEGIPKENKKLEAASDRKAASSKLVSSSVKSSDAKLPKSKQDDTASSDTPEVSSGRPTRVAKAKAIQNIGGKTIGAKPKPNDSDVEMGNAGDAPSKGSPKKRPANTASASKARKNKAGDAPKASTGGELDNDQDDDEKNGDAPDNNKGGKDNANLTFNQRISIVQAEALKAGERNYTFEGKTYRIPDILFDIYKYPPQGPPPLTEYSPNFMMWPSCTIKPHHELVGAYVYQQVPKPFSEMPPFSRKADWNNFMADKKDLMMAIAQEKFTTIETVTSAEYEAAIRVALDSILKATNFESPLIVTNDDQALTRNLSGSYPMKESSAPSDVFIGKKDSLETAKNEAGKLEFLRIQSRAATCKTIRLPTMTFSILGKFLPNSKAHYLEHNIDLADDKHYMPQFILVAIAVASSGPDSLTAIMPVLSELGFMMKLKDTKLIMVTLKEKKDGKKIDLASNLAGFAAEMGWEVNEIVV